MRYELWVRSQHAKTGRGGFSGPDTYVAVTESPDGVETPLALNQSVLEKRGIKISYFGEGYKKHSGPRSALGRAIESARAYITSKEKL